MLFTLFEKAFSVAFNSWTVRMDEWNGFSLFILSLLMQSTMTRALMFI